MVERWATVVRNCSTAEWTPSAKVIRSERMLSTLAHSLMQGRGQSTSEATPTRANPTRATDRWFAPAAMPTTTAKITKAVSCVSFTTVRKRTTERAPTRLKARATLSPMTCVDMAMIVESRTRVVRNVAGTVSPRRAQR